MSGTAYEEMFELAPVSLWLEDYSELRALFDRWRAEGVSDLRAFLNADHARVAMCSRQIKLLRVNRRTLELLGARGPESTKALLEGPVQRHGLFGTWSSLALTGESYKSFGELVAWRVSLWDGPTQVAEQKSFLWPGGK